VSAPAAATGAAEIFAALEATWPPVAWHDAPGWRVGEGADGGKRVSCGLGDGSPEALEAAQAALGQRPLAMIRPGDAALDARLAAAGWGIVDPTLAFAAPADALAGEPPPLTVFEVAWPPLAVQDEIWEEGGIGAGRRSVMARAPGPKLALLGRLRDTPAATAFVACAGGVAMVHALEVRPGFRRDGLARHLMAGAARWAQRQGAGLIAALVTRANAPALALYRGLGMEEVAAYHYRAADAP
jgi:GNAT superfamily N-acetyltransferase